MRMYVNLGAKSMVLCYLIAQCRQKTAHGEVYFNCFATFQSNFLQVPSDYGTIYYAPNTTNGKTVNTN